MASESGKVSAEQFVNRNRGFILNLQQKNDETTHYHKPLKQYHSGSVMSNEFVRPIPIVGVLRRPLQGEPLLEYEVVETSNLENKCCNPDNDQHYICA